MRGFGEEWVCWLAGNSGGAGDWFSGWLGNAEVASNVVIAAANLYVARVLYLLSRHRADDLPPPWVVAVFAGLVAFFGASHLALLLDGRAPSALAPVALKVLTAVLWVAIAARLPAVVTRITQSPSITRAATLSGGAPRTETAELALMRQRLRYRVRALEFMARNETWLLGKGNVLHELRAIIDDLEAVKCKN